MIPDALDVIVTLFATFFLVAVDPDVVVCDPGTTVSEPINPNPSLSLSKQNSCSYASPKQASSRFSKTIFPSSSYPEQSISELAICEVKPSEHTLQ